MIFQFQVHVQENSSLHHKCIFCLFMTLKVKINSISWLHEILSQKLISQWQTHVYQREVLRVNVSHAKRNAMHFKLSLHCTCQIDLALCDFPMIIRKYLISTIKHCHAFKFFSTTSLQVHTLLSVAFLWSFSLVGKLTLPVMTTDYHSRV